MKEVSADLAREQPLNDISPISSLSSLLALRIVKIFGTHLPFVEVAVGN